MTPELRVSYARIVHGATLRPPTLGVHWSAQILILDPIRLTEIQYELSGSRAARR
jgi:hypothetical protein